MEVSNEDKILDLDMKINEVKMDLLTNGHAFSSLIKRSGMISMALTSYVLTSTMYVFFPEVAEKIQTYCLVVLPLMILMIATSKKIDNTHTKTHSLRKKEYELNIEKVKLREISEGDKEVEIAFLKKMIEITDDSKKTIDDLSFFKAPTRMINRIRGKKDE